MYDSNNENKVGNYTCQKKRFIIIFIMCEEMDTEMFSCWTSCHSDTAVKVYFDILPAWTNVITITSTVMIRGR